MKTTRKITLPAWMLPILTLLLAAAPPAFAALPLKVFILVGQSNMEGQAVADLDGKDYNQGKGTLNHLMLDPAKAPLVKHLKDAGGQWAARPDVWVRYKPEKGPVKAGPLTLGFTPYGGRHHFGPELQFGHVIGDHFPNQVLIIKTAWGGKSLYQDFRPPSAGGKVGPYYTKMLADIREALENLKTDFPAYDGAGYELAGLVWYQGWNDGVSPKTAIPEYEANLVHFIKDVRAELKTPNLPILIGELTGPWVDAPAEWTALRKAQAAAARQESQGSALFVQTRNFVRAPQDSPNPTHGHHEFGNAETYFLVGDAFGKGMINLLKGNVVPGYQMSLVEGWTVHLSEKLLADQPAAVAKAIELLAAQLREIIKVLPAPAVAKLRTTPLWFSPHYPGVGARAEYHPGKAWLKDNGRPVAMVKCVEFTNIPQFEAETRRMPNFALHELAHAYHDQVLGFNNPQVKEAYEQAKAEKLYDNVEHRAADGRTRMGRSYAMTNPQEYFAECTEGYFSRNDIYPYNREELAKHDPRMHALLASLWKDQPPPAGAAPAPGADRFGVRPPPPELKAPAFYKKYIDAEGYPILASEKVNDYALKEAAYLINLMLAKRPDVRAAMIRGGSRMCIIAHNEFTTDLPGWQHMKPKDYWDARARGMGGSQRDPLCSCGEENLLGYPGDPYSTENILIHEFAHNIHLRGMISVDPTFDGRVKAAYDKAMAAGLWKGKYASVNHHEYFAEGVQSWFDNNRQNDHDHNHVDTRAELLEYDPALAALCREVFGDTVLKYTKPATRLRDHLAGYDPAKAPTFVWPQRLLEAKARIRREAEERSNKAAEPKPAK